MALISYKQAAHQLRVTVKLLKWYTRYGALGTTLVEVNGEFDEAALGSFDQLLRGPWPKRYVPAGIADELRREARGACVLCGHASDVLEAAHVQRKDVEVAYYCQHPHNLIMLCPTCHSRYDQVGRTVTHDVVQQAKTVALSRLMEDVDRDIQLAGIGREQLSQLMSIGSQDLVPDSRRETLREFIQTLTGEPLADFHVRSLATRLSEAAAHVSSTMPVTGSVLTAYSEELDRPVPQRSEPSDVELWEGFEQRRAPGECEQCGESTEIESGSCLDCDADLSDFAGDTAYEDNEGWRVSRYDPQDGDTSERLRCPSCGSSNVDLEFTSLCGGCQHFVDRAFDA